MSTTVREVLAEKPHNAVFSIAPHESVFNAVKLMSEKGIGALPVIGCGEIVGILTERDYSRKVVLAHKSSATTRAHEIMTKELFPVSPDDYIESCLAVMTENNVRYLPVFDYGEIVGLISMGDIVRAIISEREFTIEQLTKFIVGGYSENVPALYNIPAHHRAERILEAA